MTGRDLLQDTDSAGYRQWRFKFV